MASPASTNPRGLMNGAATMALLLLSLTPGTSRAQAPPPGGFVAGTREMFALNLSSAPPGQLPKGLSARDEKGNYVTTLSESLSVVSKDGVLMLKAIRPVELLIELSEVLPNGFTIEFDLIPKYCCGEDISFEGTREMSRSDASMNVVWWRESMIAAGGGEYVQRDMPGDLKEIVGVAPTQLAASFQGTSFKLFTNGRNILDLSDRQFVRGRVLRVMLGGQADAGERPVYLSKLRIAATSGTVASASTADMATLATGTPTEVVPTGVMPVSTSAPKPVAAPQNPATISGTVSAPAPNSPASRIAPAPSSPTNPLPVVSSSTGPTATQQQASTSPNTQTEPRSAFAVTVSMGSTGPVVAWPVVPDAGGYSVSRQKVGDICCNNDSGRGYTATSPWQDKALPSSGTYSYLVLANTAAGILRAETQFSYTAPSAVMATTMTTATGMVSGTVVGATATQQTGTVVGTVASGSTVDVPAKYRVTLTGFRATATTREPILLEDGRFDEAYASAAVVLFNRKDSTVTSHTVVRTREYGDVGGGKFGDRIQAGTATSSGGIGGLGSEHVPAEFDPNGSTFPVATSDRFPLLVWEGTLNAGAEALLIVPSIWDRDLDSTTYVAWKTPFITSSLKTFVASTEVVNETKTAGVVQIVSDQHPGFPFVLPMSEAEGHVKDRPIGAQLDPPQPLPPVAIIYKDRHVMLTREKLADLAPGASKLIPVPFAEAVLQTAFAKSAALGAFYTLYLRIERTQ